MSIPGLQNLTTRPITHQLWLLGRLGLSLGAGSLSYWLFGAWQAYDPGIPEYLANCDGTDWQYLGPPFTFRGLLQKIDIDESYLGWEEAFIMQKSIVASKIYDAFDTPLCEQGCNSLKFVLAHPTLKILISYMYQYRETAFGSYSPLINKITLYLATQRTDPQDPQLSRLIFHEAWHAAKTLIHTGYRDPSSFNLTIENNPTHPYNLAAPNASARKLALDWAIQLGDARILRELPDLLQKQKKHLLTHEAVLLAQYQQAVRSYIPQYHLLYFENDTLPIFSKIKNALDGGDRGYKIKLNSKSSTPFEMYVDNYETDQDGKIILMGYAIKNPKEKTAALIQDTLYRKYYRHDVNSTADERIAENGEAVNKIFYPERNKFHNCEYNEAFPRPAMIISHRQKCMELFMNVIFSAGRAASYSFIKEGLIARGISREKVRWLIHFLSFGIEASRSVYFYGTLSPLLPAFFVTMTLIKYFKFEQRWGDQHGHVSNTVVSGLLPALYNNKMDLYGLLNLVAATASAFGASVLSQRYSHSFWKVKTDSDTRVLPDVHREMDLALVV